MTEMTEETVVTEKTVVTEETVVTEKTVVTEETVVTECEICVCLCMLECSHAYADVTLCHVWLRHHSHYIIFVSQARDH